MKYDGNVVGPRLRELRKSKKLTLDELSEMTGLSVSTLKQLEQGGRRMSIRSLYLLMSAYQCDANTLLNISTNKEINVLDLELNKLQSGKREKCRMVFKEIIELLLSFDGGRKDA